MNYLKEILRLKTLGESDRSIAKILKVSRKTIMKYQVRAKEGLTTPLVPMIKPPDWISSINWEEISSQITRGVSTLDVLWEEEVSKGRCPVSYSAFWKQFQKHHNSLECTMIRRFSPGERVEIDYCDGIDIIVPSTGEILKTHLFVGVLCNSRYPFAEFSFTQSSEDFLNSHVRMFEFFGGVPAVVSPDNLKSAVNKVHRYEPEINQAYTRLAEYYDCVIAPARVRTPKDKAIVERTVQIFQRWFYSRVRNITFTSLIELNRSLQEHLKLFIKKNHRIFKMSREAMFEEEKAHLKPLPEHPYVVSTYKKAKLHTDCHLEFDKHLYSAPWRLRGEILDVWATERSIEIYNQGERVAFHSRLRGHRGKVSTNKEHYPERHQAYLEVTPTYLREKASQIGSATAQLITTLLDRDYPLGFVRRCQGILALAKKYSKEDLERACVEGVKWEQYTVKYLEKVIKHKQSTTVEEHINREANPYFRGKALYH